MALPSATTPPAPRKTGLIVLGVLAGLLLGSYLLTLTANPNGYSENEIGTAFGYLFLWLLVIFPLFIATFVCTIVLFVRHRPQRDTTFKAACSALIALLLSLVLLFK